MVDLAVKQLHLQYHAALFCLRQNLFEPFHSVLQTLLWVHTAGIATEADKIAITRLGHQVDVLAVALDQLRVEAAIAPTIFKINFGSVTHGAINAFALKDVPLIRTDQIDGPHAETFDYFTQLFSRQHVKGPTSHRVVNVAFEIQRVAAQSVCGGVRPDSTCRTNAQGTGDHSAQQSTSV